MRYFSLFSGIGGFELGIHDAIPDAECAGYSEVDRYAEGIYRYHFPEHRNYGDATRIISDRIPGFELMVAGFPCQAFSVAGKRRGFQDARGTLFFEIARICSDKRPRYILLENVGGLLSHKHGETFQSILGVLSDIGYILQWEVLNSKNFGVPQNRNRVFIVGHLRDESRPEVFPIGEGKEAPDSEESGVYPIDANYAKGAAKASRTMIMQIGHRTAGKPRFYDGEIPALTKNAGMGGQNVPYVLNYVGAVVSETSRKRLDDGKELSRNFREGQRVYSAEGLAGALTVNKGYYGQATGLYQTIVLDKNIDGKVYRYCEESPPLRTASTNYNMAVNGIRRLTPIECERLQGFPDYWTQYGIIDGERVEISDTQRYKCLGNAVTVNVVREIAKRL